MVSNEQNGFHEQIDNNYQSNAKSILYFQEIIPKHDQGNFLPLEMYLVRMINNIFEYVEKDLHNVICHNKYVSNLKV